MTSDARRAEGMMADGRTIQMSIVFKDTRERARS